MPYYAVANGRDIGIFLNWNDCNTSVKGYKNALYKKFDTKKDAEIYLIKSNVNISDTENKEETYIEKEDFITDYYVYTDGACSNNGNINAVAGIGIFFGVNDSRNLSKKIEGKQTNNTAELSAIIEVFSIIEKDIINGKKVTIISDSEYAIKCATSYGEKCCNKNYITNKKGDDIPNKELVKTIYELYKNKSNIKFQHIRAHTNNMDIHSIGNKNADKLANLAIGLEFCPYTKQLLSKTNFSNSIEDEITEIKNDIKELKNTIKELTEIIKAVYEFEDT